MANGFGHARLKSRFQMMLRSESSRWSWLRVLLLLPVLVLTAVLLADAKARIKYQWPTHTEAISTVSVAPTTTAEPTASSTDRLSAPKAQHQTTAQLPPEPQPSHPANRVVTAPSQMAQFPGGNAALRDYMRSHLPALNQSGGVVLRLTIAADGRIRQAEVLRSGGAEADEAAISMASGMPCWIPGRQDGQVCTSTYTLPVSFDD
jgi:TonB family protein